jgi:hypothetical protein
MPPRVRGAWVERYQRLASAWDNARCLSTVTRRNSQTWLNIPSPGANQSDDLQVTQHLGLIIDVWHHAIERWRVWGLHPNGAAGMQSTDQRVRIASTAVQLHGQVDTLRHKRLQRPFEDRRVLFPAQAGNAIPTWWDRNHPIHGSGSPLKEVRVPIQPKQHNLGPWVGHVERFKRGKTKDEVTEGVCAKHGDPPHPRQ